MTTNPDQYFVDGCGRCPKFATQECKVKSWMEELIALRKIILTTELNEEAKWGFPCYTHNEKNILILSAFKDYCAINFFKGALLKDPHRILIHSTKNSNADRSLRFTEKSDITELESIIKKYIREAIEIEKAGLQIQSKPVSEYSVPEEFQNVLDRDPALKAAFEALTPGRRKGYLLHFSQPKQSKTKISRIEKCIPKIMDGVGLNDRY